MHLLKDVDICTSWEEELPSLRLPHPSIVSYDDDDCRFFAEISTSGTQEDFTTLFTDYVLFTISEVIRIIDRIPCKSPMAQRLLFQKTPQLCPAAGARWNIYMMVSRFFFF